MFINQFLIKNLSAKEHFFFEINKYFKEKSAYQCTNTPNLCTKICFFLIFSWLFAIF